MKIYVAAVEALRKKERQHETQFTTKIDGFFEFHPPLNANVLFLHVFFYKSHPVYDQTQGSRAVFFLLRITLDLNVFTVLLTLRLIGKDVMNSGGVKIANFSMINMLQQVHLASQLILLHSSHPRCPEFVSLWFAEFNLNPNGAAMVWLILASDSKPLAQPQAL